MKLVVLSLSKLPSYQGCAAIAGFRTHGIKMSVAECVVPKSCSNNAIREAHSAVVPRFPAGSNIRVQP
jgi:hypothetical protein